MRSLLLLLLISSLSCTHRNKTQQQNVPFADATKRESSDLKPHDVLTKEQGLKFQVRASKAPQVELVKDKASYYYASVDIGSLSPVECFFYATDISPATSLKTITNNLFDSKEIGKIKDRKTSFLSAGMVEGYPWLMLQTAFRVEDQGKNLLGNVKAIVGTKEVGNVICIHNEVGYQETFMNVFSDILKSFEYPQVPKGDLIYKSIVLVTIKNLPVGYTYKFIGLNQYRYLSWVEKGSLLIPVDDSNVAALDDLALEFADKEGRLNYGLYKAEENGSTSHLIELSTLDYKNYVVKGAKEGKEVDKEFTLDKPIFSNAHVPALISKRFFKEDLKYFSVPVYSPDQKLDAPTLLRLKLEKTNPAGGIVSFATGDLVHHAVVEKDGTEEALSFNVSDLKIEGKRIFKEGSYPGSQK